MKLGVFDSGLGGLLITKAIHDHMPDLDIMYYGDTLHLPYGNRSDEAIYRYCCDAMDLMFEHGCALIVMACNTASAACLRRLQQDYLPAKWPERNIIGVVIPLLEAATQSGLKKLGLIGTHYTVSSGIFPQELSKIDANIALQQKETPLLVPLIEHQGDLWVEDVLNHYLSGFEDIEALILACTHYAYLRPILRKNLPDNVQIIAQDEIIPQKLAIYLNKHPEYSDKIHKNGHISFYMSDITPNYIASAEKIYGRHIDIQPLRKAEIW